MSVSIDCVSDTARWTAAMRARESDRPDAVFSDPLAEILAGAKGRELASVIPRSGMVHWGVVTRTCAIDRLIENCITAGVDLILNLGAGLDTRPYRMNLPAALNWIEGDLPGLIAEKNLRLADFEPRCRLERVGIDLADRTARNRLLGICARRSARALVLTEGVLTYLTNSQVADLADDLHGLVSFPFWIQDFDDAGVHGLPAEWRKRLKAAPFLFEPGKWFEFFKERGWEAEQIITHLQQAEHIGRPFPFDPPYGLLLRLLPAHMRRQLLSLGGATLLRSTVGSRSSFATSLE